ncbi:hypothetical protein CVT24_010114 [Panaeolus cyanescens]|uniref:Uncharacterized protein n=1 Tax=Panaeolus cyanescens TaxID=181874 RepID=A0A409WMK8_9AGAR|nr:hypothetical protein CVT24_010114 [Panaeolus cyanescens]
MSSHSPSPALDFPEHLLNSIHRDVWKIALTLLEEAIHSVEHLPIEEFMQRDFLTLCDMLEHLCDGHFALRTPHFNPVLTDNLAQHTHNLLVNAFQHCSIATRYQPVRRAFHHLTTQHQRATLGALPPQPQLNFHLITLAMTRCVEAAPTFVMPVHAVNLIDNEPVQDQLQHPIDLTHEG